MLILSIDPVLHLGNVWYKNTLPKLSDCLAFINYVDTSNDFPTGRMKYSDTKWGSLGDLAAWSRDQRCEMGRSSRGRGEPAQTPLPSRAHKLLCVQGHEALSHPQSMWFLTHIRVGVLKHS